MTPEPVTAEIVVPHSHLPVQDWRRLLAAYATTAVVESMGVAQVYAFLPTRLREVGLPDNEIAVFTGLFSSLIFVFGILLVPFWGVWADMYSRRAVIVRSAVVEVFVFLGMAVATTPWQVAIAMLLVGFQLGNTGVMLAALRDVAPRNRVGTVSALLGAASSLGFALGPVIGAWLIDGLRLPTVSLYVFAAAATFGVILVLLLGTREVRPAVVPTGRILVLARRAVAGVLADPAVRRIFLIFGVSVLANQMSRPFVPLLVEAVNGKQNLASAIGLVAGTAALLGAVLSPIAGALGDRIGFRRVLATALLGAGIVLFAMGSATSVGALAAFAVLYAALQAATQAMVFGLVAVEVAPERRSATLNLVLLPLYVAGIVGPSLGGIAAGVGGVRAPFDLAGAIFLAGGLVMAWALVTASRRARV